VPAGTLIKMKLNDDVPYFNHPRKGSYYLIGLFRYAIVKADTPTQAKMEGQLLEKNEFRINVIGHEIDGKKVPL
jgi:hypothetical protein